MKRNMFKKISVVLATVILSTLSMFACKPVVEQSGGNEEKVFRYVATWEKAGIVNHYYGGSNVGPLALFSTEGLYIRLDTSSEIVPMLADGPMQHIDSLTSRIKIKENAKWQNGEDFVAMDIVAYYYLNHTTATNYMLSVDAIDEKTVEIKWNPNRPLTNDVKEGLIALDPNGTVQYQEFRGWADTAIRLVKESPLVENEDNLWSAFGRRTTDETYNELYENFTSYQKHNPSWYVGTGAFKLESVSPTQMILVKNPYHWAADNIKFEKVYAYTSSDLNLTYNMLANNKIDYADGVPPVDTIGSILNSNKSMVHLKMLDIDTIGISFNMEKPIWTDKVREAFQYIFDRDEIKNAGNSYGITVWNSVSGLPDSELRNWLSEEHYNMITKYTHDEEKAVSLLREAGWEKRGNKWYVNGAPVKLYLGCGSEHPGWSGAAEAAQAALLNFGIDVVLRKTDTGSLFANGMMENSTYDMVITWTEINPTLTHPYGSFEQFSSTYGKFMHVPRYEEEDFDKDPSLNPALLGGVKLEFDYLGAEGGKIKFTDHFLTMYSLEGEKLENVTASIAVGLSKQLYGVNFYQNVTGSFINTGMIDGVPLESYWSENRNVSYVPDAGTQEANDLLRVNFFWGDALGMIEGKITPTEE